MRLNAFILAGFLSIVSSVQAAGLYKILEARVPPVVRPGQQVVGKFKIQVISTDSPAYNRPFLKFISLTDSKQKLNVEAIPWHLPDAQKAGEIFWVSFVMNLPMNFPSGPAVVDLIMAREISGKGWDNAVLQDGVEETTKDTHYQINVTVLATSSDAACEYEKPLVVTSMIKPTLDGKVDPDEWKSADRIDSFVANEEGSISAKTRAYVGHDEKNFYLGFVCDEPLMAKTGRLEMSRRDPAIYNTNETVYVFLNPTADRTSYMQFIVDILNQRLDALGLDPVGYNPPWESKVYEGEKSWSVEMAIPFGSLGVSTPIPGSRWYGNFFRCRFPVKERSAWRPTGGGFESPGFFGTIIFDSVKKALLKSVGEIEGAKEEFPEKLAGAVGEWRKKIADLEQTISSLNEAKAYADYSSFLSRIETLRKEGKVLNRKRLQISGSGLIIGETRPYELFVGQAFDNDKSPGPVQVTMLQDEWVDLAWNLTNVTEETITVRCSTLEGEGDFKKSPDYGGKGYEFLKMKLSGMDSSWCQAMPVATADSRKMWDAIVPISSGVVRVAPGETAQVWLTLHLPKDARAGEQKFWATIYPIDGTKIQPISIPVTVKLVSQSITAKRYIEVFTWNWLRNEVINNKTWFQAHLDDLAAHGVSIFMISGFRMLPRPKANPDGTLAEPMDFTQLDRLLDEAKGKFHVYWMNTDIWERDNLCRDLIGLDFNDPNYNKAFKTWFATVLEHFRSRGITDDNLVINPCDESTNANCQQLAKWMKEVDPKCRIVIDNSTPNMEEARKINALNDVWMPHYKDFFQEEASPCLKMIRDSKKTFWMYYYSEGPNEKAQDPTLVYLARFWWCYDNKLTGIGYWANQYYGNPWYREICSGTYDTSMVYPVQGGVVPSRRWQAWRRGWQDYNLISILREKLEKNGNQEGLKKLDKCIRDVVSCPGNPVKRESARDWIKSEL